MAATVPFRSRPLSDRLAEHARVSREFPGRVGIIVERAKHSRSTVPVVAPCKFLVPSSLTVAQFQQMLQQRMCQPATQALYLFLTTPGGKHVLAPSGADFRVLADSYAGDDGFILIQYAGEDTFGGLCT